MRVVERNDKGNVTYRKKYKFGDEVDTDHLDETHVENLVNSGALVESEDDLTGWNGLGAAGSGTAVTGAATAEAADHSDLAEGEDRGPEDPEDNTLEGSDDGDQHDVDEYDAMDYAELQTEAKQRSLNAGGSAQDLRARLRADDEA